MAVTVAHHCYLCDAFATIERIGRPQTDLSATSRRQVLATAATSFFALLSRQKPAIAAYGDSSTMKGFDYIDYLVEKNTVADPSTYLYKGADRNVQLKRMSDAAGSLQQIPVVAKDKKWSQVNGILTGPLGTLIQTMNQIVSPATDFTKSDFGAAPQVNKEAKAASQKVKADLYAIGQAAMKKSEAGCIESTEAALKDLEAFVKVAF